MSIFDRFKTDSIRVREDVVNAVLHGTLPKKVNAGDIAEKRDFAVSLDGREPNFFPIFSDDAVPRADTPPAQIMVRPRTTVRWLRYMRGDFSGNTTYLVGKTGNLNPNLVPSPHVLEASTIWVFQTAAGNIDRSIDFGKKGLELPPGTALFIAAFTTPVSARVNFGIYDPTKG